MAQKLSFKQIVHRVGRDGIGTAMVGQIHPLWIGQSASGQLYFGFDVCGTAGHTPSYCAQNCSTKMQFWLCGYGHNATAAGEEEYDPRPEFVNYHEFRQPTEDKCGCVAAYG